MASDLLMSCFTCDFHSPVFLFILIVCVNVMSKFLLMRKVSIIIIIIIIIVIIIIIILQCYLYSRCLGYNFFSREKCKN